MAIRNVGVVGLHKCNKSMRTFIAPAGVLWAETPHDATFDEEISSNSGMYGCFEMNTGSELKLSTFKLGTSEICGLFEIPTRLGGAPHRRAGSDLGRSPC